MGEWRVDDLLAKVALLRAGSRRGDDLLAGVGPRSLPEVDLASLLDRADRPLDRVAVRRLCLGRRVLVTGAGGSIGSALCEAVAGLDPAELVMMDRSEHALFLQTMASMLQSDSLA